jgi:hypothetical protein
MSANGNYIGECIMKQMECVFEKEVMTVSRLQQWTDDLRAHASTCPVCSETNRVNQWMQGYSHELESRKLPSHRLIWLKAQYALKQERLSKFDIAALVGMSVVGLAGFVGLLLWQFPHFLSGFIDLTGRSFPGIRNVFSHSTSLPIAIGVVIMVWVLTRDSSFVKR